MASKDKKKPIKGCILNRHEVKALRALVMGDAFDTAAIDSALKKFDGFLEAETLSHNRDE
jgi:hypothetical protein